MNGNTFNKVNMEALRQIADADYIDGDLILIDNIKWLPKESESCQMDMIIILMCIEGKLQIDINGKTHHMYAGEILVCPPHMFLNNYMISPDFDAKIFGLSYQGLQRMAHVRQEIWNTLRELPSHPIFTLPPEGLQLTQSYYSLLAMKLQQPEGKYHKEVMHALFQAVFYDLCSLISPIMQESKDQSLCVKQGDLLVKRFLALLNEHEGKVRTVGAFAEELCVTPKYLSTLCKMSTGKTALEWIHEYTTEVIIQKLKYSNLTIKEIADELEFPNLSFFGKFVKTHLGMSPTDYRRHIATGKA